MNEMKPMKSRKAPGGETEIPPKRQKSAPEQNLNMLHAVRGAAFPADSKPASPYLVSGENGPERAKSTTFEDNSLCCRVRASLHWVVALRRPASTPVLSQDAPTGPTARDWPVPSAASCALCFGDEAVTNGAGKGYTAVYLCQ